MLGPLTAGARGEAADTARVVVAAVTGVVVAVASAIVVSGRGSLVVVEGATVVVGRRRVAAWVCLSPHPAATSARSATTQAVRGAATRRILHQATANNCRMESVNRVGVPRIGDRSM